MTRRLLLYLPSLLKREYEYSLDGVVWFSQYSLPGGKVLRLRL